MSHNNSRIWQVGRDQVGNAVLEWNPRALRIERVEIYEEPEPGALDQTYNLLKRLDCDLDLEDPVALGANSGHDPYNTGTCAPSIKSKKIGAVKR